MQKNKKRLGLLLVLAGVLMSMGIAAAGPEFAPDGNGRKGKYLYRKSCRACHDGSQAASLSPSSKIQSEWQKSFAGYESLACKDDWDKQSHTALNDIYSYMYNHAYDSPNPATCK